MMQWCPLVFYHANELTRSTFLRIDTSTQNNAASALRIDKVRGTIIVCSHSNNSNGGYLVGIDVA